VTRTHLPDALFTAAQAAWPGIVVSREAFEAWARPRGAGDVDEEGLARASELYLCCACDAGEDRAIAAFEGAFFKDIAAAVARLGPSSLVDDVKSELRQRLFVGSGDGRKRIADFAGRGGLARWVRAIAVRAALNLVRGKKGKPHEGLDDDLLSGPVSDGNPELAHMKELYGAEWREAFAAALKGMEPQAKNLLRLHHIDGLTLAEIAALYDTSVATAARRVATARGKLMAKTRAELESRLGVEGDELDSILRLIESRLTVGPLRGP
jgi:RNA polymerase sigma-70 factor (ECF subfamily)